MSVFSRGGRPTYSDAECVCLGCRRGAGIQSASPLSAKGENNGREGVNISTEISSWQTGKN